MTEKLLTIKQLASELGRSRRYISYMKCAGFQMPGGLATVAEARAWLARNTPPCAGMTRRANTQVTHGRAQP